MKKKTIYALHSSAVIVAKAQPIIKKAAIDKILPNTSYKDVKYTDIPSVLEVTLANDTVVYVHTQKGLIFFGEIYDRNGNHITYTGRKDPNTKKELIVSELNFKELKDFGIQIQKSDTDFEVIVFTDPDCPFCIRLDEYFKGKDIEVTNVFMPIDELHPKARKKSIVLIQEYHKITTD